MRKGQPFKQELAKIVIPPVESNPRFWNPNQAGVVFAPEWFRKKLKDIDQELEITWDNYNERWLVWMKAPKLQNSLNRGWSLLFILRYADGSYMPLDERCFARIYEISAQKWGNAKEYFKSVEREWERDKERAEAERKQEVNDTSGDYYDYMKIKNIGQGSKFTNHWQ